MTHVPKSIATVPQENTVTVHDGLSKLSAFTEPTKVLQAFTSGNQRQSLCYERHLRFNQLNAMIRSNNASPNSSVALRFYPESLLSGEEFQRMRTGYIPQKITRVIPFRKRPTKRTAEEYLNYAEQGLVTPVKNQKECGACYAFTALSVLGSAFLRKFGKTTDFSEQQGIDCTFSRYDVRMNRGCHGGHPYYVLLYAKTKQFVSQTNYRYHNRLQHCNIVEKAQTVSLRAGVVESDGSDEALMQILRKMGPVSVAISVGDSDFKHYGGGIITQCGTVPDHAVVLVGYRVSDDAEGSYWIIKNSWGTKWGENGFARIRMGACNISEDRPVAVILK
ncbi:ervatamin-C-like isoform X3 [Varroa jacobsoni]|uniref:ervatamin-C-like isoform X3 n=1 Tax=Varroa jacobsoni TaxID=62625 RepID=UPI000BFA88F5|nr:ervatamin-C-like isoform X3 [Varroa jacobsoni]